MTERGRLDSRVAPANSSGVARACLPVGRNDRKRREWQGFSAVGQFIGLQVQLGANRSPAESFARDSTGAERLNQRGGNYQTGGVQFSKLNQRGGGERKRECLLAGEVVNFFSREGHLTGIVVGSINRKMKNLNAKIQIIGFRQI